MGAGWGSPQGQLGLGLDLAARGRVSVIGRRSLVSHCGTCRSPRLRECFGVSDLPLTQCRRAPRRFPETGFAEETVERGDWEAAPRDWRAAARRNACQAASPNGSLIPHAAGVRREPLLHMCAARPVAGAEPLFRRGSARTPRGLRGRTLDVGVRLRRERSRRSFHIARPGLSATLVVRGTLAYPLPFLATPSCTTSLWRLAWVPHTVSAPVLYVRDSRWMVSGGLTS